MSYELISYPDYLAHYGIKGQKWGIRRFQNPDGSLTAAGKEHYSVGNRMEKAFNKESKKLSKLKRNADLDTVMNEFERHDRKAKTATKVAGLGASASLLGLGIGLDADKNPYVQNKYSVTVGGRRAGSGSFSSGNPLRNVEQNIGEKMAIGGAALAIGALGKAAYHQMMKKSADRKVRAIERGTADLRVQKQINKMTKMFADTPYSELIEK